MKKRIRDQQKFKHNEITVELYVVSTGLRQMILGSKVADSLSEVWGCEFAEGSPKPGFLSNRQGSLWPDGAQAHVTDVAYAIDNTTKTRAIFEINKGTNHDPKIDVNATIAHEDRRVPFQNMIYIADGPSDIPVFSIIKQYGGKAFAVYKPQSEEEFRQVKALQNQGRVQSFGPADYTEGTQTYMWILTEVEEIASRIVRDRERVVEESTSAPPQHILERRPVQSETAGEWTELEQPDIRKS